MLAGWGATATGAETAAAAENVGFARAAVYHALALPHRHAGRAHARHGAAG